MTSTAAVADDGLAAGERVAAQWYANDWLKFDELRALGATGAGVKIAVIDTGINPDVPELAGADVKVVGSTCMDADGKKPLDIVSDDPALSAHGTNVVSMLVGNGVAGDGGVGARGIAPDAEVLFYGVGPLDDGMRQCVKHDPAMVSGKQDVVVDLHDNYGVRDNRDGENPSVPKRIFQGGDPTALAARIAIRDGADVITSSISTSSSSEWAQVMIEAKKAGVIVVAATKNPAAPFSGGIDDYDYMTNGVVAVSAIDETHALLTDPVDGWVVEGSSNLAVLGPGRNMLGVGTETTWGPSLIHGTSYAGPVVAGSLALGVQKFPDASSDQLLQALVRTTGDGVVHEPVWTDYQHGYGELNTLGLLKSDPLEFPDKNPLYVYSIDDPRCLYSDGGGGDIINGDRWHCRWATDPTPDQEAAYWAERSQTEPAGRDEGASAEKPTVDTISGVWTMALWTGAGLLMLGVLATAVIVPVLVSRGRKRSASEQVAQQVGFQQVIPMQQTAAVENTSNNGEAR